MGMNSAPPLKTRRPLLPLPRDFLALFFFSLWSPSPSLNKGAGRPLCPRLDDHHMSYLLHLQARPTLADRTFRFPPTACRAPSSQFPPEMSSFRSTLPLSFVSPAFSISYGPAVYLQQGPVPQPPFRPMPVFSSRSFLPTPPSAYPVPLLVIAWRVMT